MNGFNLFEKPWGWLFYVLLVVDLVLKGISLFKSAKRDQKFWFVALLLVNSMGILPIFYLLINKDVRFECLFGSGKKSTRKPAKKTKR